MKVFEGIILDIKEAFQKGMKLCIGTVYLDQKDEFEKAIDAEGWHVEFSGIVLLNTLAIFTVTELQ